MLQTLIINTGTPAGYAFNRNIKQNRIESSCRSGICYTHLPCSQNMVAGFISLNSKLFTTKESLQGIIFAHSRANSHILASRLHLSVHKPRNISKVMVYTHIHNIQIHSRMTRQHINSSAAIEHIINHLRSNLSRKSRDSFGSNPMVGSKTADFLFRKHRRQCSSCQNIF